MKPTMRVPRHVIGVRLLEKLCMPREIYNLENFVNEYRSEPVEQDALMLSYPTGIHIAIL